MNERKTRNPLRAAQLHPNKRFEVRLDYSKQRQRQVCICDYLHRCRRILLLFLLFQLPPLPLVARFTRPAAHHLRRAVKIDFSLLIFTGYFSRVAYLSRGGYDAHSRTRTAATRVTVIQVGRRI